MVITLIVIFCLSFGFVVGAIVNAKPEPPTVQEPPRELVPLVPASWRKRHGDKWN